MLNINNLKKKGVFFTLDAVFAIIATLTIILIVLFYMSQVGKIPYNKQSLSKLNQDTLTVLEKDYTLRSAIRDNSNSTINLFLNSLPSQICARVELRDENKTTLQFTAKQDCNSTEEPVVARRAFVGYDYSVYYAKMESWHVDTLERVSTE